MFKTLTFPLPDLLSYCPTMIGVEPISPAQPRFYLLLTAYCLLLTAYCPLTPNLDSGFRIQDSGLICGHRIPHSRTIQSPQQHSFGVIENRVMRSA
jgi:hypothetical protein